MPEIRELDLTGLYGGEAAVKLRESLRWLARGEVLAVVWDEDQVGKELEMFCRRSGDDFHYTENCGGTQAARITRTNRPPALECQEEKDRPE